ncbi:MAG: 30S ribosomal protein S16 [Deltaproteobacteria bacterium]|nr:30S ribosomal protein S16 [Deltaproteobacteria bacterium]
MAVKLRLTRKGAKKKPFYRIVAADTEAPRDGRFLDIVGTYDPTYDPANVVLKNDKIDYWLGQGAIPTETVAEIIKKARKIAPEASA